MVKCFKKSLVICIIFCWSIFSYAIETATTNVNQFHCAPILKYGLPGSANEYLCRDAYAVGYSYQYKQPLWVAYKLTGESVSKHFKRHNKFAPDKQIPISYRAQLSDYNHSGYDRGHLAPYAAIDISKNSAKQSFLLSNMSPQAISLNRQGWAQLEKYVRFWAKSKGKIWVFTGPIFKGKKPKTIGKDKITVPSAFYKVIYAPEQNEAIAFAMPNKAVKRKQVEKYIVPISQIEQRTGLKFLTSLPLDQRDKLINTQSKMWRTKY